MSHLWIFVNHIFVMVWMMFTECAPYEKKTSISLANVWEQNYKLGDNMTINCDIHNLKKGQYVQFVRLINGEDYLISNDTKLAPAVRATGRYQITIATLPDKIVLVLKIHNIHASDGGRLGCKIGPKKYGLTAYTGREITVYVPIESVSISYKLPNKSYVAVDSGDPIHLRSAYYRVQSGIKCTVLVKGGSIEPTIDISLGRQKILSRFKKDANKTWSHTKGGMLERGYSVVMTYESYHPSLWDNNKWLTCRAKVPYYEAKEMEVKVNVSYPPRFECKSKSYAFAGDRHKTLRCFTRLNPEFKFASWWWRWGKTEAHVPIGVKKDGYTSGVNVAGPGAMEFFITIDTVDHFHFHSYFLEVDNGFGLMHHQITLYEGPDPDTCRIMQVKETVAIVGVCLATGYMTHGYGYT